MKDELKNVLTAAWNNKHVIIYTMIFVFMVGYMRNHVQDSKRLRYLEREQEYVKLLEQDARRLNIEVDSLKLALRLQDPRVLWTARVIYSETNRPSEMKYVGWVVRNRVEVQYNGKKTYRGVALDRKQFSAFNRSHHRRGYYMSKTYQDVNDPVTGDTWMAALENAYYVVYADSSERPIPPETYYFYSEVSMPSWKPHPSWRNLFTEIDVPDVEDRRFRWFADYDYRGGTPEDELALIRTAQNNQPEPYEEPEQLREAIRSIR
jgi:hypothetical protein